MTFMRINKNNRSYNNTINPSLNLCRPYHQKPWRTVRRRKRRRKALAWADYYQYEEGVVSTGRVKVRVDGIKDRIRVVPPVNLIQKKWILLRVY
jgi:hypothetical protein